VGKKAGELWAVCLSLDGRYLAGTTADGKISVWDLGSEKGVEKVRTYETKGSFGLSVDLVGLKSSFYIILTEVWVLTVFHSLQTAASSPPPTPQAQSTSSPPRPRASSTPSPASSNPSAPSNSPRAPNGSLPQATRASSPSMTRIPASKSLTSLATRRGSRV
jgi:hypothetical protein